MLQRTDVTKLSGKLPEGGRSGWKMMRLGDVCEKASSNVSQNQLEKENGSYPIYGASGFIKNVSFFHRDKDYISIVKDGAGIGRITLLKAYSSVIGTLQYLIPKENIDIRFLYYFLSGVDFGKYKNGSTIPHIYFKDYAENPILIPSLSEQQQIVALLDDLLATINQVKENLERNLQNARELFESYLQAVFANKGRLSERGFMGLNDSYDLKSSNQGNHTNQKKHSADNGEDWEEKPLGEITTKIGSGATPRGGNESYKEEGISLIRSMNVHDRFFKEKNLAFIDEIQAKDLSNVTIQKNDVLVNITGASVARCCTIPEEYLPARVNQHVSIIRPKKEVINHIFLSYLLTSKFYKDQLLFTGEQGSTRQAITKVQLENFIIQFPKSLSEQQTIVNKLDSLSAETKRLEAIYQQKINDLEELKKSILQKAFCGELV